MVGGQFNQRIKKCTLNHTHKTTNVAKNWNAIGTANRFYNHLVFQVLDSAGNPQELSSTVALSFCSKKTTSDWQSLTPANVGMSLHIAFPPLDGQVGPFSFWRTPIHGGATQEDPPNLSTIRRHQWWSLGSKPKDVKDDLSWKKLARFLEEHQESLKSCFCFRWFS